MKCTVLRLFKSLWLLDDNLLLDKVSIGYQECDFLVSSVKRFHRSFMQITSLRKGKETLKYIFMICITRNPVKIRSYGKFSEFKGCILRMLDELGEILMGRILQWNSSWCTHHHQEHWSRSVFHPVWRLCYALSWLASNPLVLPEKQYADHVSRSPVNSKVRFQVSPTNNSRRIFHLRKLLHPRRRKFDLRFIPRSLHNSTLFYQPVP